MNQLTLIAAAPPKAATAAPQISPTQNIWFTYGTYTMGLPLWAIAVIIFVLYKKLK